LSLFETSPKEVNFATEEEACFDITEFRDIVIRVVSMVDSKYRRYPRVVRVGGRWRIDLGRFVDATRVWVELQRKTDIALRVRDTIRSVLGYGWYETRQMELFLRYLMFYMASTDVAFLRMSGVTVDPGVLYFPMKVIYTGSYVGRRRPFTFQVEVVLMPPALYVSEDGSSICIDVGTLDRVATAILECLSGSVEVEQEANLIDTILANKEIYGVEWVKTHAWWSQEAFMTNRAFAVAIEKRNDYGSYEVYKYYAFGIRPPWPGTSCEDVMWYEARRGLRRGYRTVGVPGILMTAPAEPVIPEDFKDSSLYKSSGYSYLLKQSQRFFSELRRESFKRLIESGVNICDLIKGHEKELKEAGIEIPQECLPT